MTVAATLAALATGLGAVAAAELAATRRRVTRRRVPVAGRAVAVLARLARRGARPVAAGLQDRLDAAGVRVAAEDYALARAGATVAGLLAVVPLAWAAPSRAGLVLLLAGPAAGHLGPAVWLARRARRRAGAVERELADVLDLLRVAIAAGLSPFRAAAEVGTRHTGLLAAELRRAAARRSLGLPAEQVLAELDRRAPGEGITALTAALRRAERHGAPLGGALAAQARAARSRSAARTIEAAARAAPRIQLVVALLLVPSVLALVAAALLPAVGLG
jgi:tight adherence protein C